MKTSLWLIYYFMAFSNKPFPDDFIHFNIIYLEFFIFSVKYNLENQIQIKQFSVTYHLIFFHL